MRGATRTTLDLTPATNKHERLELIERAEWMAAMTLADEAADADDVAWAHDTMLLAGMARADVLGLCRLDDCEERATHGHYCGRCHAIAYAQEVW